MRKKIQDLAYGRFYNEKPVIVAPTEPMEFEVFPEDIYRGSFVLRSANIEPLHGIVCSAHSRITCLTTEFSGTECSILFEFQSRGLLEGEISKGTITVISDGGECSVRFLGRVIQKTLVSSVGNIGTLDDFVRLAQSSWDEAYRMYTTKSFACILERATERERLLYRALGGTEASMAGMEEFLVGTGRKERIAFSLTEQKLAFAKASVDNRELLTFAKEGWGNLDITITSDNDAFAPVKSRITAADLVGSHGTVEFIIRRNRLHGGNNFGRIILESLHQRECCEICVYEEGRAPERTQEQLRPALEKHRLLGRLARLYLDLRLKRIVTGVWSKESCSCLERLRELAPENKWYVLYQAQALLVNKQRQEADWLLMRFGREKEKKDSLLFAYYLYLTTLSEQEPSYVSKAFRQIQEIYHRNQENLWLFLIMLFLDPELARSRSRKLSAIREKVAEGMHSPILYLEAYELFKNDVYLLQKADEFELRVLSWAAKEHAIVPAVARQIVKVIPQVRSFHPLWYGILQECYQVDPQPETLAAIVSYCIRWNVTTPKQFLWFHLGIQEELNIAGLYEAWMDSLDAARDVEFPRPVMIYFQYQNEMDWRKRALLYAYILKHSQSQQSIYEAYQKKIEQFAIDQLFAGNIDENLAVIYRDVLGRMVIDEKTAAALSAVLDTYKVKITDKRAVRLVAVGKEPEQESSAVIANGVAYLPACNGDCLILAENDRGVRYLPREDCIQRRRLFDPKDYAGYQKRVHGVKKSSEFGMSMEPGMSSESGMSMKPGMSSESGMNMESGLEMKSGYEHIPISRMLLAVREKLAEPDPAEEEQLLGLCTAIFERGTYNEAVLAYLIRYFQGSLQEEERLWLAAREFELDTYALEERFLSQLLYTDGQTEYMGEIFLSYFKAQGKEMLLLACLSYISYRYFVKEMTVKDPVLSCIARQIALGNSLNDCCRLACLKWLTGLENRSEEQEDLLEQLLREYLGQGKAFAFYQELPEQVKRKYHLNDRIFLEYRTAPFGRVTLSYDISRAGEDDNIRQGHGIPETGNSRQQVAMDEMYQGIFVKELVLFYGEEISYFIWEEQENIEATEPVKTGSVSWRDVVETAPDRNDADYEKMSRYDLINAMLVSRQNGDEDALCRLRSVYERMDRLAE